MARTFTRRSILRGAAGACLALPALEIMQPRGAKAGGTGIPSRYLVMFGGISTGRDGTDNIVPDVTGGGYDLKLGLQPLGELNVQSEVSVVSNLLTPWGTQTDGSDVPPAGRLPMMHNSCYVPLVCGVRPMGLSLVNGPSSDQLVGEAIGGSSLIPTMAYRVQADGYGAHPNEGRMSYRMGAQGIEPVTPKVSPHLIFEELFSGFVADGDDPDAVAAAELARRRRLSVLDLLTDQTDGLAQQLGAADRLRMEQHLDYVRDLEMRVQAITPGVAGEGCFVPTDPVDPAVSPTGYSDEDARGELITELIALAFTCDISRAGSLMLTSAQAGLHLQPFTGTDKTLHDIGHSSDDPGQPGQRLTQMSHAVAWHVRQFARLVARLRDAAEVDGTSVLDHSAIVLVFEGGHGFDPMGGGEVHSTENMSALVAGRAGGLDPGRHVVTNQAHPSSVILSAMHAVGVDGSFGEVTEDIPALFA